MPFSFSAEPYKKPSLLTVAWLFLIGYAPALLVCSILFPGELKGMMGTGLSAISAKVTLLTVGFSAAFTGLALIFGILKYRRLSSKEIFTGLLNYLAAKAFFPGLIAFGIYCVLVAVFAPVFYWEHYALAALLLAIPPFGHWLKGVQLKQAFPKLVSRLENMPEARVTLWVWGLCTAYFAWLFFVSYKISINADDGGDMSIYLGWLYRFAYEGKTTSSVLHSMSYFGEHFEPTMCLSAPLLRIWPAAGALLLLSSAALAYGGIPVYKLTKLKTGSAPLGLALTLCYFFHPFLNVLGLYDYYELFLAPFFFLWLLWFMESGKSLQFWLFLALCLGLREDLALSCVAIGLYMVFARREYLKGSAVITVSAVYFVITVGYLIPWFRQGTFRFFRERYADVIQADPDNLFVFVTHLLADLTFDIHYILGNPQKLLYLLLAFGPLLFMAFRQHKGFILLVPPAVICFFSSGWEMYSITSHFTGYWVAAIFFNTILGLQTLRSNRGTILWLMPLIAFIFNYISGHLPPCTHLFLGREVFNGRQIITSRAQTLLQKVPAGADLDASDNLLPLVVTHFMAMDADHRFNNGYMLLDLSPKWAARFPNVFNGIVKEVNEGKCHVIDHIGYITLTTNKPVAQEKTAEFMQLFTRRFEAERQPSPFIENDRSRRSLEIDDINASGFAARTIHTGYESRNDYKGNLLITGPGTALPAGKYNAVFRMKAENAEATDSVAVIEVLCKNALGEFVASRQGLTAKSFGPEDVYKDFILPLDLNQEVQSTELRVYYLRKGRLTVDYTELIAR
ncbi:MAG: DUF2079 domain-containing protein [Bacteroidota bacterium]